MPASTYQVDPGRTVSTVVATPASPPDLRTQAGTLSEGELRAIQEQFVTGALMTSQVGLFQRASQESGGFVHVAARLSYLPMLMRPSAPPVLLYEFVEALDGVADYAELQAEFPGLSYSQIAGALAFLRKLAQFNTRGVDTDALEDEVLESNPEFQRQIEHALTAPEDTRVLDP